MPRWTRSQQPRPWAEIREQVRAAVEAFALVAGPDDPPAVAWSDGPGPAAVAKLLDDLAGWTLVEGPPAADVTNDAPVLHLDRRLSDEALAVCLVRFYASQGRHWSSSEAPAYQQAWRALTMGDDPAHSGYPIPDVMAQLLLAEPPTPDDTPRSDVPPGAASASGRAEELSAKLAAVGYERLWAVAFAAAP